MNLTPIAQATGATMLLTRMAPLYYHLGLLQVRRYDVWRLQRELISKALDPVETSALPLGLQAQVRPHQRQMVDEAVSRGVTGRISMPGFPVLTPMLREAHEAETRRLREEQQAIDKVARSAQETEARHKAFHEGLMGINDPEAPSGA